LIELPSLLLATQMSVHGRLGEFANDRLLALQFAKPEIG
jgi:hypothetical protein